MSRRPRSGTASPRERRERPAAPPSARLILAVTPRARMCSIRSRNVGGSSTGSTRSRSARCGSMAATTARAVERLAVRRARRRTRGRRARAMRVTRAPVTICAPAVRRDRGQRLRQRARAASHRDAAADRHGVRGEPLQQHRAGAGRPRPGEVAEDRVRADRRLQQVALEPFRREIGDGHRHPAREPREIAAAERRARVGRRRRAATSRASACRRSTAAPGDRARRSSRAMRCVVCRNPRQRAASRGETADGSTPPSAPDRDERRAIVRPAPSAVSAGSGVTNSRPRAIEPQRAHDVAADRSERVAERRRAEARRDLGRDRRAADLRPLIERSIDRQLRAARARRRPPAR